MNSIVQRIGRRRLLGSGLIVGSLAVLVLALVVIATSLQGDDVMLPEEGSLQDILNEDGTSDGNYSIPGYEIGGGQRSEPHGAEPVGLAIPQLYVSAPVIKLGLDADNVPLVPDTANEVAWYDFSATPGKNRNAVFSGHVDWQTRAGDPIPGVFYRLRELHIGDEILVTLEDESVLTYKVTGNVATDYEDPNVSEVMGPTTKDVITLITCGGSWINDPSKEFGGVYSHRIVVRAELVKPAAAASLTVLSGR
jgi:LPXTG-site transpeptidase (sortase) family protein